MNPAHGAAHPHTEIPEIAGSLPHAQGPRVSLPFVNVCVYMTSVALNRATTFSYNGSLHLSLTRSLNHLDRGSHIILISTSFFRWSLSVVSQNRVRMSYRSQITRFYSVLELGESKLCPQRAIVTMDGLGPVVPLSWVICYSAYIRRYLSSTVQYDTIVLFIIQSPRRCA